MKRDIKEKLTKSSRFKPKIKGIPAPFKRPRGLISLNTGEQATTSQKSPMCTIITTSTIVH